MKGSLDDKFKKELKQLIVDECDLIEIENVDDVDDDGPMFGPTSQLQLDSIDAFQISIAIQNFFGITITDSKVMRKIMTSINSFADYLQPE